MHGHATATLLALGALLSAAFGAPLSGSELVALDGSAQAPPLALALAQSEGWALNDGPAEGSVSVVVALRLAAAGVARMHSVLELSSPELRWGAEQLRSELSPPAAALDATRRWLSAAGARVTAETPRWIVADVDATAAERCFGVSLRQYVHRTSGRHTLAAAQSIRVPRAIKPLLSLVAGLNKLPRVPTTTNHALASATALAAFKITPAVIGELYDLPKTTPSSANIQGIAAFNNESFTPTDLSQFQTLMHLPAIPVHHTIGPATLPKGGTGEGSLDVQYMAGVSPQVPTVVWATAGQVYNPDDKSEFSNSNVQAIHTTT